jgi:hypothetical protein
MAVHGVQMWFNLAPKEARQQALALLDRLFQRLHDAKETSGCTYIQETAVEYIELIRMVPCPPVDPSRKDSQQKSQSQIPGLRAWQEGIQAITATLKSDRMKEVTTVWTRCGAVTFQ